jgi:hypothetical protein
MGVIRSAADTSGTHPRGPDQHPHRERATGIEPAFRAWEARVLPLNYARVRGPHYRLSGPDSSAGAAADPIADHRRTESAGRQQQVEDTHGVAGDP